MLKESKKIEKVLISLIISLCLYSCIDNFLEYKSRTADHSKIHQKESENDAISKVNRLISLLNGGNESVQNKSHFIKREEELEPWVEQAYFKDGPLYWLHKDKDYFLREYTFIKEEEDHLHFKEQNFPIKGLKELAAENGDEILVLIKEGKVIFHSNESLYLKNIFKHTWETGEEGLFQAATTVLSEKNEIPDKIDYLNRRHGKESKLYHAYIPRLDWYVILKPKHEHFTVWHSDLRKLLLNSLAFLVLALSGLFYLFQRNVELSPKWLVSESIFCSIVLLASMCFIWTIYQYHPNSHIQKDILLDDHSVDSALEFYNDSYKRNNDKNIEKIKTGVFVQSVEFLSGTNVKTTGVVWQKYTAEQLKVIGEDNVGVFFPEADSIDIDELYTLEDPKKLPKDIVLIKAWAFQCTLRQSFDYYIYPFDFQDVWLRLKHKKFQDNILLVPDFDSYELIAPELHPGVEKQLVLPGWIAENSFYSYKNLNFNTSFGKSSLYNVKDFPELHFNVSFRRDFLGSLVTEFIPIIVAGILLFALLLIGSRKNSSGLFGFSAIDVVLGCAALFFVIVFQHIALRSRFGTHTLIYMEYFYFLLYIMMVVIIFNSILFASEKKIKFIHCYDNLYPKILYWPFITSSLSIVTFIYFY